MVISPNKWELDVQAYLNTCNITSSTPRKQIRDFAAGVNDLGLWNNMVCWPLRSSQNAGTGTTAYSLGGLGTYNGTLVNGPTWGVDGITTNAASQRIDTATAVFPMASPTSIYFPYIKTNANATTELHISGGSVGLRNGFVQFRNVAAINLQVSTTQFKRSDAAANATKRTVAYSVGGDSAADAAIYVNGSSVATTDGSGSWNAVSPNEGLFRQVLTDGTNGYTIPMFAHFSVAMTSGNHAAFHDLYRNTLGTGLGLP